VYRHLQLKKLGEKNIFFGMIFAMLEFGTKFAVGCHFGSWRPPPAILAVPYFYLILNINTRANPHDDTPQSLQFQSQSGKPLLCGG